MAKQKTRKGKAALDTSNELLENPEAIATRLGRGEAFLKENTRLVGGIIGLMILIIAGIVGYQIHKANQNEKAQGEMFQAVYYYEQDSVDFALNGDGVQPGFLDIIDQYGGTDASNLAHFYVGSIYLSQGEYQSAVDHLEEFSSDDFLVQAQAYSLTGDAYLELGKTQEAIQQYKNAANYKPNKFFTPKYLFKLAIAYEEAGNLQAAIDTYGEIESNYSDAYEYTEARKHKARLEGLASN
ncbi:tetratricopeptide repeat protein [Cyclobacterium jeungdonense]|uniref:Tetratricopeptide repeat protein n=1 Tax=Cyclobacterium jeungdonense TaxID=708087 RepID=A0ABT8C5C0_9BACT|nr:tetratricopeptide repeat protein [Cyclobacterium jeungdonense]MDN3687985.1 tetratricopeptide repeat protein [Cyclobacterium jeungdonense]